jgi:hypothetical protein
VEKIQARNALAQPKLKVLAVVVVAKVATVNF